MSNQILYIPPGGIREVEFDDDWFQTENTEIYMDKAMLLFHLISKLMGLIERYHRNLARIGRYENHPEIVNEFIKTAANLAKKVMQKLKN